MHQFNRSTEMAIFVQVVESSGLSSAARRLDMTPSAISKLINRLEARLGVRLLNRTTRKLQLTPEGSVFYDRCLRILEDIASAELEATLGAQPRGRVRVNSHVPFGKHYLMPLISVFLKRYPEIALDVVLCDQVVDLLDDRADVAIRTGPLNDSRLVMRRLGSSRMVVVAAPDYLEQEGIPQTPDDLVRYNQLGFGFTRHLKAWPFKGDHAPQLLPPSGNLLLGDGETMRKAAIAGLGLARMALFHVHKDIEAGRLVPLLEDYNPGDEEELHAVFIGPGKQVPARMRVFLDFLTEHCHLGEGRGQPSAWTS
ncbi:LysR family transcriptional regulator [Xanthomonas hyacinthi]|uniref:LysR family transcriptional regulator n=2 Tax=Xanthomonas hyacinthi TaxID=56455 RepID=A0A2S7EUP4_9XANT|nr:LysR family transcriptional regulator [Xanthomonas hyacinthi]KLD76917.1 LysR family transcriptional regulator [Xanthomonas hyacinthi DSM 19077]PPU96853.1 LysR family transcriptional regulator [Xanthomonas hyacinthi]QGY76186.1 LysR family transcriptional regulator [Xanthomonas hyacinthi]